MNWKDRWVNGLDNEKLFQDSWHKTRFKELLDCYGDAPFFSRGLCKCMYLSAWDEEHFGIMLEMLMSMSLGHETTTSDMRINGEILADQQADAQSIVYQLSNAFLDDVPFYLEETLSIPKDIRYIIEKALEASAVIDKL
ncbi:MAG: hypothetical protein HFI33_13160 [Lachnospiraceae bacterium]|nr:hypothetical protein [Lachnospiraceae bacterium]